MKKILAFLLCSTLVAGQAASKFLFRGFLQLSNNDSGNDDDGLEDDTKVLTIFLLNVIGCILCCGLIQGVIMLSKRMNAEIIHLRKNYKQYLSYLAINELKKANLHRNEVLGQLSV